MINASCLRRPPFNENKLLSQMIGSITMVWDCVGIAQILWNFSSCSQLIGRTFQMRHSRSSPVFSSSAVFMTSAACVYFSFVADRGVSVMIGSSACGCDLGRERTDKGRAERRPVGGRKTSLEPGRSSSTANNVAKCVHICNWHQSCLACNFLQC